MGGPVPPRMRVFVERDLFTLLGVYVATKCRIAKDESAPTPNDAFTKR